MFFFYLKCINNYFSHYPLFTLPIFIEEYLTSTPCCTTAVGKSTVMEMRSVFRSFHTGDFFFPLMEGLSICHFLFPFLLSIAVAANCSSSFIHWKKCKHTLSELGVYKNTHPCPLLLNEGNSRLEQSSLSPPDSKLCIEVSLTVSDQCLSTSCTTRTSAFDCLLKCFATKASSGPPCR